MTYSEFIEKYDGKAVDYDGSAGVQCVDLIKLYLKDVFNIQPFSIGGSAKNYFDGFESFTALKGKFEKIYNTPTFIPMKGDICVFGSGVGGGHGHVSIANGDGTTSYFYSYDMNWYGKACKLVKHKYNSEDFLGVLRPLDRSNITEGKITFKAIDDYYPACDKSYKSLVDALASVKADYSFSNRRKIAKANNISAYIGTAKQNTKMLELLKDGKLLKN